ncbi:MAG TPA: flagellar basal body rod protein [Pseudogracilibacillus sp.]|nr:flagellar basal body rod protein [Pseudogracilibacillus sp.]
MRHFLLFIGGLVAGLILLANLGPLLLLGVSVWLLYLIFKKFLNARSTGAKVGWVILGLVILSISLSNMYALIAIVAGFILYWIYKNWNKEEDAPISTIEHNDDPFTNFEYEWRELTDKKI